MPPYGFDTTTLRIPGFEVINYEHKDVSDNGKIPPIKIYILLSHHENSILKKTLLNCKSGER